MATEEFLSCLSRAALETAARAESVNIEPRVAHTRERMVEHFKDGTFVWPGALFPLTPEELAASTEQRHGGSGWVDPVTGKDSERGEDDSTELDDGEAGFGNDDLAEREAA